MKIIDYLRWWFRYRLDGETYWYSVSPQQFHFEERRKRSWRKHNHRQAKIGELVYWCEECMDHYGMSESEEVEKLLKEYE